jgi:outer membrane protein assembly factor BamB
MNMHAWARERDELVEVIYPAMDGFIHFADLETGNATRNSINIGFPFKGCGAVDPRGYPLLYVGAGDASSRGAARIFIISLVDGAVLHTFGNNDGFAPRRWWPADSAPLIDAENDMLIYPSENGVIYFIELGSVFDVEEGTMTIDPSPPVKWRFNGRRSHTRGKFWLGFETSPSAWRGHLFIADNGGHLVCLDLNTLEPVWVQDTLDDTNTSPVLELEDGHPYIYISTSFRAGWRAPAGSSAVVPIWKIDAMTGEVVWQTDYTCYTVSGISGGVQGTIATGRHELSDLIFVPIARTPTRGAGILAALDKQTGEVVWEFQTRHYSWSSPVCVYDNDGKGYIVYPTSGGLMYLLDGLTGEQLDSVQLGGTVEASPAVFGNTVVIGTRSLRFFGIELT